MSEPRDGDTVKVEFEGVYCTGHTVLVSPGVYTRVPPLAEVTVVERKVDLVPGQVWKRKSDDKLYVAIPSRLSPDRVALTPAAASGATETYAPWVADTSFDPVDFELLFDPRWEEAEPTNVDFGVGADFVIYNKQV